MTTDPTLAADIYSALRALEARIERLESAPPSQQMSISPDGTLRILDAAGAEIVKINSDGVITRNAALVTTFDSRRSRYTIDSGSSASQDSASSGWATARTYEWHGTASVLTFAYEIAVGSGDTAEVRILQEEPSGAWVVWGPTEHVGPTVVTGHTAQFHAYTDVDISPNAAGGAPWRFALQVRRSAGTGTVTLHPTFPLIVPT